MGQGNREKHTFPRKQERHNMDLSNQQTGDLTSVNL